MEKKTNRALAATAFALAIGASCAIARADGPTPFSRITIVEDDASAWGPPIWSLSLEPSGKFRLIEGADVVTEGQATPAEVSVLSSAVAAAGVDSLPPFVTPSSVGGATRVKLQVDAGGRSTSFGGYVDRYGAFTARVKPLVDALVALEERTRLRTIHGTIVDAGGVYTDAKIDDGTTTYSIDLHETSFLWLLRNVGAGKKVAIHGLVQAKTSLAPLWLEATTRTTATIYPFDPPRRHWAPAMGLVFAGTKVHVMGMKNTLPQIELPASALLYTNGAVRVTRAYIAFGDLSFDQ